MSSTECVGVLGKWFGHRFKTYEIVREPVTELPKGLVASELNTGDVILLRELATRSKYVIRCARCGVACAPPMFPNVFKVNDETSTR